MSYYTSLSGLNAAATQLSVTSNNIANVATTGFKKSRADFSDIVAQSMTQSSGTPGLGTSLRGLDQQFTQGSYETTNEGLNLAISGQGFFVTTGSTGGGVKSLTRDGSFGMNGQGYVVDKAGNYLQGLPVDANGNLTGSGMGAVTALRIPQTTGTPKATTEVTESVTLPADADLPASRSTYSGGTAYKFSPTDPDSYNYSTNSTLYDGSGNAVQATTYFVRTKAPSGTDQTSSWDAHVYVGGKEATATGGSLTFDASGTLTSPTGAVSYTVDGFSSPIGVTYGAATKQSGSNFAMTSSDQNGMGVGTLSTTAIDTDGILSATYSDGTTLKLGRVAIANVINPSGLTEAGDNRWQTTSSSGDPVVAGANSDGMGLVKSGTLEVSNVDVTNELVNLIQAQRNFQANAKAIDTASQITETAVNLRS